MAFGETAHIGDPLRAFDLRDMTNREKDRRFGERMHGHVQKSGEIGERSPHTEGEGDDAHVLNRRIGKHPFDVAAPVEHEGGEYQRNKPDRHHQRTGGDRRRIDCEQHLETEQRIECHVKQKPGQYRRYRRGPSAWASGSQACSGASPILVP